jgi:hypothetical protein
VAVGPGLQRDREVCAISTSPFSCQAGYQFARGSKVLAGVGKNFHGGVTTARLQITITP